MDEKNAIKVLIATAEHDITGYLYAPNASEMDSKKKKAEAPGQKILLLIEVRRHTVFLYAYYITKCKKMQSLKRAVRNCV